MKACAELEFVLPIFSGILGIMMPGDLVRYIPMSYFPNLEIEFIFNEYAFFTSHPAGTRDYYITQFELYTNILQFESEIHDSMDSIVAQSGLHLVTQAVISGPELHITTASVPSSFPINLSLKSLKTLFFTFIYEAYRTIPSIRMINRCSHNLT